MFCIELSEISTCVEIGNRCHFDIIIPRESEVVLKVALKKAKCAISNKLSSNTYSRRLAIVDRVDEPKIVDDCMFEEALGVVEDNVDLCLLHRRDNACKQKLTALADHFIKIKTHFRQILSLSVRNFASQPGVH